MMAALSAVDNNADETVGQSLGAPLELGAGGERTPWVRQRTIDQLCRIICPAGDFTGIGQHCRRERPGTLLILLVRKRHRDPLDARTAAPVRERLRARGRAGTAGSAKLETQL